MLTDAEIQGAVDFHGHKCFGLCVGLIASKVAMERLGVGKAKDEELVVTIENNSCAVDAVQFVAGATLGRGNLSVKDWGKHVYTFATRNDGRAVRISLRYDAFSGIEDKAARMQKLMSADTETVFKIDELEITIPPEAEVVKSVQCSHCKEPVMESRTKAAYKKIYCIPCYEKVYIEPQG